MLGNHHTAFLPSLDKGILFCWERSAGSSLSLVVFVIHGSVIQVRVKEWVFVV